MGMLTDERRKEIEGFLNRIAHCTTVEVKLGGIAQDLLREIDRLNTAQKNISGGRNPCEGCAGICKGEGNCAFGWAKDLMRERDALKAELAVFQSPGGFIAAIADAVVAKIKAQAMDPEYLRQVSAMVEKQYFDQHEGGCPDVCPVKAELAELKARIENAQEISIVESHEYVCGVKTPKGRYRLVPSD